MKDNQNFAAAFTIMSVIFILIGLMLVLQPEFSEQVIGVIVGSVFIVYGAIKVFGYIRSVGIKSESFFNLISGLLNAGLGVYIIINHGSVLAFATAIIGIIIFFESLMRVMTAFEMKKSGYERWQNELTSSVISLVVSIPLVLFPFYTAMTAYRLIGIALIANGAFRLLSAYRIKNFSNYDERSKVIDITEDFKKN